MIGDDTEDPLAGYDVKFSGQVPYLPWAKVKATRYIWDGVAQPNVKGTIFGIEVQLSDSVRMEFGSEDNNTVERKTYARFTTALPLSDHESMTSFSISKKAFQNSDIVNLGDLEFVERSNKIRVEKLLNGVTVVLGEYNAPTKGASCTLYNSAGVALGTSLTGDNGQVDLKGIALIPRGLVSVACKGGTYTDEATGKLIDLGQMVIRAATIYSGTGPLMMLSSPLSEVAYQLADTNSGDRTVIAKAIMRQNIAVAAAFGVTGIDITTTTPTDINTNKATNDDAGKFGMALAAVSQMGENSADSSPAETITALVADMADGNIDGRVVGKQTVDMTTAMNNFSNGEGANNITDGKGAGNVIGVTNSVAFITLGEATTNTYTVVLNTQPTGNVTITPNSNDTGAATVSAAMTFTSANWSTPQTVTVTGVADDDINNETVTISHTITGAGYAGVTSANVIASVTDDDTVGVTNSATAITLGEATTSTYAVVLNTQPTGNVTITPNSNDTGAATVSAAMTFTSANWSTPQTVTVTGVADDDINNETVTISHTITGAGYAGVTSANVIASVTDDDTVGVTNSATAITLGEATTSTYAVVLNTQPTGNVTITPNSNDTGAATVSAAMTFTSANWSTPQTVTVTGVADDDINNETVTISHTITGAGYAGVTSANVIASVTDDDTVGVTNSATAITLGEATTSTYAVVLNTQPTGNVTITPNSNDTGAATVSAAMTFTSANWSTPQTVTVTGVNDADATDETVTISHTITGAGYAGVTSANVIASVTDDEIFFNNLVYSTVTSPDTGKVWLDRNLGATQVATSKTDSAAYGHYYQWGRNDDGHESSSSAAVATIASSITNAGNLFITSDIDWTNADTSGALRTVAWADGGANDICPAGFSVPTEAELTADTIGATTTNITNIDTVFSSFLKIPTAGYRNRANNGSFHSAGSLVLLWSRGTNGVKAHNLNISSGTATSSYIDHAYGFSVRCIKN
ncbi:hypothetical protein BSPWISOXPB_9003 [uncultured Gammaproteobacteria bacterium]|nr:hypothetical protein BSPWISOXPB_9003 [uncultured Gammaproteobacteria bacterium]